MILRVTHSTTVPKMEILARSVLTKMFAILLFCPFSDGHTSSDVLEPRCNDTQKLLLEDWSICGYWALVHSSTALFPM